MSIERVSKRQTVPTPERKKEREHAKMQTPKSKQTTLARALLASKQKLMKTKPKFNEPFASSSSGMNGK